MDDFVFFARRKLTFLRIDLCLLALTGPKICKVVLVELNILKKSNSAGRRSSAMRLMSLSSMQPQSNRFNND